MFTVEQEQITQLIRELPPDLVREILDFTLFLKEKRKPALPIDYSTEWTEEDMRDCARSSMEYFNSLHPDDDWGFDEIPMDNEKAKDETAEDRNV